MTNPTNERDELREKLDTVLLHYDLSGKVLDEILDIVYQYTASRVAEAERRLGDKAEEVMLTLLSKRGWEYGEEAGDFQNNYISFKMPRSVIEAFSDNPTKYLFQLQQPKESEGA